MAPLALRFLLASLILALTASSGVALDAPARAFIDRHCIRCHGPDLAERKLRLDKLPTRLDTPEVGMLDEKDLSAPNGPK